MASIVRRPDGTYRPRYRDEHGKEHRHFKRKVDAQRWLDEVTATTVTGDYVDPAAGRITFRAWFTEWSGRQVWERGTTLAARQAADSVTFADVPMRQIRPSHVQQWVKAMSQPADGRRSGLAPSTIRTGYNYVHMAMRAAVVDRIIKADPSAGVPLPRARKAAAAMTIPVVEEVGRALDVAPIWFRPFIAVRACAGLRLEEACAAHRSAAGRLAVLQRRATAEPELRGPPVAAGPQGAGLDGCTLHDLRHFYASRTHRVRPRRGDRAAGARALLGDDHARRLLPPVAHGRGPHARRSGRPDGRRDGRTCGLPADRDAVTTR